MRLKVDPSTRRGAFLLAVASRLARLIVAILAATWRVEIEGEERLAAFRNPPGDGPEPRILAYWHDRAVLSVPFLLRHLHRRGVPLTLLASQSRDGEIIARMVQSWGVDVVRGSSSRGGRQALRQVHRAITKARSSPVVVPDGPRGPAYELKLGVLVLAQATGAPIQPLGFAASRAWRLRSWDRLIVPKPFARVAIVFGESESVPPKLVGDAQETERRRIEAVLDAVTNRAESMVG